MAKIKRQKIRIHDQVKWISGRTQQEIIDKAIELYVDGCEKTAEEQTSSIPCFGEYAQQWLMNYKKPKLRHTTYSNYCCSLNYHIKPVLGNVPLNQITTGMIQKFYTSKSHLAHSTVRQMAIVLNQVFSSAEEDGYVSRNPTSSKRLTMSKREEKREALSAEAFYDIAASLNLLSDRDKMFVALLMFTGMRRGEAIGLRWEDIDFSRRLIYIQRAVTYKDNDPVIDLPKSKAGIRSVPMEKQLSDILTPYQSYGFIIGNGDSPITKSSFHKSWVRIEKTIDMYGATPHILRHTYITLASTVIDIKTLQSIAGHADIQTTMNRYAHAQTEKVIEAGEKLERIFHRE
jgi:integrase